ncbi:MAG: AAA family ATPase [Phycisphaerales bacterium]
MMDQAPRMLEGNVAQPAAPAENPVRMVVRQLRGRLHIVLPLAAALGLCGMLAGWFALEPQYTSMGMIRVAPTDDRLFGDDNKVMPLFESYVGLQAENLQSRRVRDRALADRPGPAGESSLRQLGWPSGDAGVALLARRLQVGARRGGQTVNVSVTHEDPRVAQRAVNAVLESYEEIFGEETGLAQTRDERTLEVLETELQRQLSSFRQNILTLTQEYGAGSETLDRQHQTKIEEIADLDKRLSILDTAISERRGKIEGGADEIGDSIVESASDRELETLVREEASAVAELESLSTRYGPAHRTIRAITQRLESIRAQIDARLAQLRAQAAAKATDTVNLRTAPLEQLEGMRKQFSEQREAVNREAVALAQKRLSISALEDQVRETRDKLERTRKQLDTMRLEKRREQPGRVTVASRGDLPVVPSTDRRIPLAFAGGVGGVGIAVGVVFLYGLLTSRYRFIEDVERAMVSAPLLGTLPDLSVGDPEQEELAAASVHHLRNMLQLQRAREHDGGTVYTITSAAPGDGKTSMTLSLGMSFAAAGHRTLLIDADFYGRGLSKSLGLRDAAGLMDAVKSANASRPVVRTRFPDVWALPAGRGDAADAQALSRDRLDVLLQECRAEFDVVVIDTGPLLGSIEGNLASALSDGVVLMLARGQDSKILKACLSRLATLGAVCSGLVFNRASKTDFVRSVSHASIRSRLDQKPAQEPALAPAPPVEESALIRAIGASRSGHDEIDHVEGAP